MITSWNKIGINIGELFLFLAFDTLLPEGAIFARGHQNIQFVIFSFPEYLNVLLFQFYTYWNQVTNY